MATAEEYFTNVCGKITSLKTNSETLEKSYQFYNLISYKFAIAMRLSSKYANAVNSLPEDKINIGKHEKFSESINIGN